ncbi:MAG: insulinase family protein [Bdellovibrionales bacterium]
MFFIAVVTIEAPAVSALPKVSVERINGFEVHFVDMGRGESFGVMYHVSIGALHEHGRLMGRPHALEHEMHIGTLDYPGHHTLDDLLKPAGVQTHASTFRWQTKYAAFGNQAEAELILNVFLSPLRGLEWNPQAHKKELSAVIHEIVKEGLPRDAGSHMLFTQLLSLEHPWRHPLYGHQESLENLSLDDLKELYYVNYTPEFIKVAVIGNFTHPVFARKVRQWTERYLHSARVEKDPGGFRPRSLPLAHAPAPSLFSHPLAPTESERRLHIASASSHWGVVLLEADRTGGLKESQALDLLARILNLDAPGTLLHKLRREQRWKVWTRETARQNSSSIYLPYHGREPGPRA